MRAERVTRMLSDAVAASPAFAAVARRMLYEYLGWRAERLDFVFMNHGFERVEGEGGELERPELAPDDEEQRYGIQLYRHVIGPVDLAGAEVLEVGCGRGAGASYVMRYLHPRRLEALDYCVTTIRLARRLYGDDGVSFVLGRAEALPFADESFDAVLNIESAHGYSSFEGFLAEVRRVLRPGGHLLMADHPFAHQREAYELALAECGLELVRKREITPNVLRALELDSARRRRVVAGASRMLSRPLLEEIVAVEGSRTRRRFESGELRYFSFILRKEA